MPAQTLQARRDQFFQLNREHFPDAKSANAEDQGITTDPRVGDRFRGYSVLFSTKKSSPEFDRLKEKLTFAMEYSQMKRAK